MRTQWIEGCGKLAVVGMLCVGVWTGGCSPTVDVAGPSVNLDVRADGIPPLTQSSLPDGVYPISGTALTLLVATLPDGSRALTFSERVPVLSGSALANDISKLSQVGGPSALDGIDLKVPRASAIDPVTGTPIDLLVLSSFAVDVGDTQVLDTSGMMDVAGGQAVSVPLDAAAVQAVRDALAADQPVYFDISLRAVVPADRLTTALPPDVELSAHIDSTMQITP